MRRFPIQKKYKTAQAALNCSRRKWKFFATCTKAELREYRDNITYDCGLCYYYNPHNMKCKSTSCPFFKKCHSCKTPYYISLELDCSLKDFHKAARKVWEELEGVKV